MLQFTQMSFIDEFFGNNTGKSGKKGGKGRFNFNPNLSRGGIFATIDDIVRMATQIWDLVGKIIAEVLSFTKNIVGYFQNLLSGRALNLAELPISIKTRLQNGQYHVVNCLYNKNTETVSNVKEEAIGIQCNTLDNDTQKAFGNDDMIVLN